MTEEIIIDGVDVSECVRQGETVAGITCGNGERIRLANEIITKHKLCKDNPNCYYKQLKRKEQECEELKGRLNTICFDSKTNNNRCISYNRMAEDYEKDLKKINNYKQTLNEIENFLKTIMETNRVYPLQANLQKVLKIIKKAKEQ